MGWAEIFLWLHEKFQTGLKYKLARVESPKNQNGATKTFAAGCGKLLRKAERVGIL